MSEQPYTLRDWFAGQVMAHCLERAAKATENDYRVALGPNIGGARREEYAAALAYQMADAMMARKVKPSR